KQRRWCLGYGQKSVETGVIINGEMTFKRSNAHKAAVTGGTGSDPFKDTSGPSMNILIKLTCLVGTVIAPILGGHGADSASAKPMMAHECKMMGKCDPAKMAGMTKEECAKMCDEMGCTAAEKEACLANFDADGKFVGGSEMACCKKMAKTESKEVRIETTNVDGKWMATVTTTHGNKVD